MYPPKKCYSQGFSIHLEPTKLKNKKTRSRALLTSTYITNDTHFVQSKIKIVLK